jgi:hypothetical protein
LGGHGPLSPLKTFFWFLPAHAQRVFGQAHHCDSTTLPPPTVRSVLCAPVKLVPFPPVRRDLAEKTLLELRPTPQSAPLPGLGEKVHPQPPPPLLPPPPPLPCCLPPLTTTQGGGEAQRRLPCHCCLPTSGGERRDNSRRHHHRRQIQGGRLPLPSPLTPADRHPRRCPACHPRQQH